MDWTSRPLSNDQIEYAAKDAAVLLDILKAFPGKVVSKNVYFSGYKS